MAITNRLKKVVDRKAWEMMTPPPVATAAGGTVVYDQASLEKEAMFVNAMVNAYVYDHEQDSWVTNTTATGLNGTTPTAVGTSGAYTPRGPVGFHIPPNGGVASSSANNVVATPFALGSQLTGALIRIIGGTGAGQERYISKTVVGPSTMTITTTAASATVTMPAAATNNINAILPGMALIQAGYANVPIGTVVTAINSATTFTVATPAGGGTGITAVGPVAMTFGGLLYTSQPWTVAPDFSSVFVIYSGRYFFNIGATTTTTASVGFYDKATNLWQLGSTVGTVDKPGWGTAVTGAPIGAAWGTDSFMVTTPSNKTSDQNIITGTSTGGNTATTLNDTLQNWQGNTYRGYGDLVTITGGTGAGQSRIIIGNGTTQLQVNPAWTTIPDNTSIYLISEWTTAFTATAGASSNATTINGAFGTANLYAGLPIRIVSGTGFGGTGVVTSNTTGALTVAGLAIADVTSVYVIKIPQGFGPFISNGTANTTTVTNFASSLFAINHLTNASFQMMVTGGTGAGQVRPIVANTATQITVSPALGTALDATSVVTILSPVGAFAMGVPTSATATTITSNKLWEINQWTNYQVRIVAGTGAGTIRPITSNTANVLTVTLPFQYTGTPTVTTASGSLIGTLTAGAITSIYPGMAVSVTASGIPAGATVGSILSTTTFQINTTTGATTGILTAVSGAATFGVVPDTTSWYIIEPYDEQLFLFGNNAVTSYRMDLSNLLRTGTAPTFTTLAPTTARAGAPIAGGSAHYIAESGASQWQDETNIINGRRIYSFRGGGVSTLDYYDIALNTWVSGIPYRNSGETFNSGSKYFAEAGEIYIQKDATGRFFRFNVADGELKALSSMLYQQGAAMVGGTMWIKKVTDGNVLKYLYFMPNTSQLLARTLLIDRG